MSAPKTEPGQLVQLLAAGGFALIAATGITLLLIAASWLLPIPAFSADLAAGAAVVVEVVVLFIAVGVGMRTARLSGGLAWLAVASLYAGYSLALAYVLAAFGPVAALGMLVILVSWCFIYGGRGAPWYDAAPAGS
jgi:hypothetical protein